MPRFNINTSLQSSLTRTYWKAGQRVLIATQQPVIDMVMNIDPRDLKARVSGLMKPDLINHYVSDIWIKTGAMFAVDTMKRIERISRKQDDNIDFWEDYYRRYTRERSAMKAKEILDGQTGIINQIIDRNIEEGQLGGLGIPDIQRYLRTDLQDSLTEMNRYQAERIARTEVIGASNTGSFDSAQASGLDMKKAWLTSGLPNIRQSHLDYEAMGDVDMDYNYAPGLQYAGDPEGSPDEIINCRCTIVYNVD
jgi:hypothetical protein